MGPKAERNLSSYTAQASPSDASRRPCSYRDASNGGEKRGGFCKPSNLNEALQELTTQCIILPRTARGWLCTNLATTDGCLTLCERFQETRPRTGWHRESYYIIANAVGNRNGLLCSQAPTSSLGLLTISYLKMMCLCTISKEPFC